MKLPLPFRGPLLTVSLLALWPAAAAAEDASPATASADESSSDGQERRLRHPRTQIPTLRNGGLLNAGETAFITYLDGQLFPPALMVSVQHGLSYWITAGLDVGGGYGTFQAMLRLRMENLPPVAHHRFFWGGHIRTGFKYNVLDLSQDLAFDDVSWVLTYENTFAVRLGAERRHVLYLDTIVYFDFDVTKRDRQIDYYLMPAVLGYEVVINEHYNFFVEVGLGYSINGTETRRGLLYEGSLFPVGTIGFGHRLRGPHSALDSLDPLPR